MPHALVLAHDAHVPAGLLGEWAGARGWTLHTVRLYAEERRALALFDALLGAATGPGHEALHRPHPARRW